MMTDQSRVDIVLNHHVPKLEAWLGRFTSKKLAMAGAEFLVFGIKQAWSCLFGGLLLIAIILSALYWPLTGVMHRYDGLLLFAVGVQVIFLATGLERLSEAKTILIFHLVGTLMEIFKTSAGSWLYPEMAVFRIGNVPLFSGFMYAAVGSYLARATRVFDLRFNRYPPRYLTFILAFGIYINFYSHHYIWDFRYLLLTIICILWFRCFAYFSVYRWQHRMPLLFGFFLITLFIWLAENIATFSHVWVYPNQSDAWRIVPLSKFGSWYLLMIVSFVLVTITHTPKTPSNNYGTQG